MARRTQGGDARCAPRHVLLVLALLPALVLGPALGGLAAWVHAHGPWGGHLHLRAQAGHADHAPHHGRHDAGHRHGHDGEEHGEEEPAPEGLRIELPRILAAAPRDPAPAPAASAQAPALLPPPPWHLAPVESRHRPERCRSGWPPQGPKRSGVAALLRSSHAILI